MDFDASKLAEMDGGLSSVQPHFCFSTEFQQTIHPMNLLGATGNAARAAGATSFCVPLPRTAYPDASFSICSVNDSNDFSVGFHQALQKNTSPLQPQPQPMIHSSWGGLGADQDITTQQKLVQVQGLSNFIDHGQNPVVVNVDEVATGDYGETGLDNSKCTKPRTLKGHWTVKEDRLLVKMVARFGLRKWSIIAQRLPGRVGKQCRERWHNHLKPNIKRDSWSEEEDRVLIEAHREMGNRWSEIAKRLRGRTENAIKNHWYATKRRQYARRSPRGSVSKTSRLLQNYIRELDGQALAPNDDDDEKQNGVVIDDVRCHPTATTPSIPATPTAITGAFSLPTMATPFPQSQLQDLQPLLTGKNVGNYFGRPDFSSSPNYRDFELLLFGDVQDKSNSLRGPFVGGSDPFTSSQTSPCDLDDLFLCPDVMSRFGQMAESATVAPRASAASQVQQIGFSDFLELFSHGSNNGHVISNPSYTSTTGGGASYG